MTKKNFMRIVILTAGGLLFSLGICMCLLPEWNAFVPGVAATALGALILISAALQRWIAAGRPAARIDWKRFGKAAYCAISVLTLGGGMAMIMAFEGLLIPGIIAGIVGVALLLGNIPVFMGLK